MLVITMQLPEGRRQAVIGLTHDDLDRMRHGSGHQVDFSKLGDGRQPDVVVVLAKRTEHDLREEFAGLMTPASEVVDHGEGRAGL